MLTPKFRPKDFRASARANSTKKRLYRFKRNLRGGNLAEFREEVGLLARAYNYCKINELAWLCWQSLAKNSLGSNSLIHGKIQGNFVDLAAKVGRRLSFPTITQLVTPKFPTHPNREFSGANRELFLA